MNMKKLYSTIMMLAMMVAALSFTACGSDDGGNGGGNNPPTGGKTLSYDGTAYYAVGCTAEQTKGRGMYFNIVAAPNEVLAINGHQLVVHISKNKVAELKVGDVFNSENTSVQTLRGTQEIAIETYAWKITEGSITITKITDMEMTLQFTNVKVHHKTKDVEHSFNGTAVLNSGVYSSNGQLLSFADAIE